MTDREIIQQLEKELGIEFDEVDDDIYPRYIDSDLRFGYDFGVFDKNNEIVRLSISDKNIEPIPLTFFKLKSLMFLTLNDNVIKDLPPEIAYLHNLTTLGLSGNHLSELPPEITKLQNLTTLDLSGNQLSEVPHEIGKLQQLTTFSLASNQFSEVPVEIAKLQNLEELDLSGNQLSELPIDICNLSKLKELYIDGNPLKDPPMEIAEQGINAIRKYLEEKKQSGAEKLNEVKVILVGNGSSGKTSLVKQLFNEEFDKHEKKTHGIKIRSKDYQCNGESVKVNFWDFGGQDIMHATHQFFLSERSIYLLVLDGRKEEDAEHWLKQIKSSGGNSPVIVVTNKIDDNSSYDLEKRKLTRTFPKILKGFCKISCLKGTGISEFEEKLVKELSEVKMISSTWPTSWFEVKEDLEDMEEDYINLEKYNTICNKHKIAEDQRDIIIRYLHDLGIALHFDGIYCEDIQVLNPRWATGGVYKIINSKKLADNFGLFKTEWLKEVLENDNNDSYKYLASNRVFILELMKKFELCYQFDDNSVLVPDLLIKDEPVEKDDFNYADSIKLRIKYDFFPKSIMPRFIVKFNKDIKNNDENNPILWRYGVVLKSRIFDAEALVYSDEKGRLLFIYVNGSNRKEYLASILATLYDIHGSFKKLSTEDQICIPDNEDVTVTYNHLVFLEENGHQDYIPDGSTSAINVKETLREFQPVYSEESLKKAVEDYLEKRQGDYKLTEDKWEKVRKNYVIPIGVQSSIHFLPEVIKFFFSLG